MKKAEEEATDKHLKILGDDEIEALSGSPARNQGGLSEVGWTDSAT